MREMGLAGMSPGLSTSRATPLHKVYLYLLRGVAVERPNQVWSTDITYIRMSGGFVYLEEALRAHGKPEIFNSDQGSQFTGVAFTGLLQRKVIAICMDGDERLTTYSLSGAGSSVKHEDVYLNGMPRWVN